MISTDNSDNSYINRIYNNLSPKDIDAMIEKLSKVDYYQLLQLRDIINNKIKEKESDIYTATNY